MNLEQKAFESELETRYTVAVLAQNRHLLLVSDGIFSLHGFVSTSRREFMQRVSERRIGYVVPGYLYFPFWGVAGLCRDRTLDCGDY
jgi:hypothetical protein